MRSLKSVASTDVAPSLYHMTRVISLVPSLTETLIHCGVDVVGRTRFCVHPEEAVSEIPAVGGTKEVDWDKCRKLAPDLVILDREENTREMADACPFNWIATHVTSVNDVYDALSYIAGHIDCTPLHALAEDWRQLALRPPRHFPGWHDVPGTLRIVGDASRNFDRIEYLIWRDPWMAVSRDTFIGSVLSQVGLGEYLSDYADKYPRLDESLPREDTFYLLSSEPFPFARYREELENRGFNGAVVDGEFYSWFGIRTYQLLKACLDSEELS